MGFRMFKLGRLLLFLIFISVTSLFLIFHKVNMVRNYYEFLVEEEQAVMNELALFIEEDIEEKTNIYTSTQSSQVSDIKLDVPKSDVPKTQKNGMLRQIDEMKLEKVKE